MVAFTGMLVRNGEKLSFVCLSVVSQRSIQRLEEDHGDLKSGCSLSEDKLRASLVCQFVRKRPREGGVSDYNQPLNN